MSEPTAPSTIHHVVPDWISDYVYAAGNWKDVEARRVALFDIGVVVVPVTLPEKSPRVVLDQVPADATDILIEYTKWPGVVRRFRRRNPSVRIHVRTHNSEAFQHYARHGVGPFHRRLSPLLWWKIASIVAKDVAVKMHATTLVGISEWDDAHYWSRLPGRASMLSLPYFCPWPDLRPEVTVTPWSARENIILAMPGDTDPSGLAIIANFSTIAAGLSAPIVGNRRFVMTWYQKWHQSVPKVAPNVEIVRDCPEPWDLLCTVRALAMLTPYGFGTKTTIIDALAAGCHAIVHPTIAARLSPALRALCIECDPSNPADVAELGRRLEVPPTEHRINDTLRREAATALKRATQFSRS